MVMEFLFGNIHNQARLDLGLLTRTRLFSLLVSVLVLVVLVVFQLFIVKVGEILGNFIRLHWYQSAIAFACAQC